MAHEEIPSWGVRLQKDVEALQTDVAELAQSNTATHSKLWEAVTTIKETMNNRLPLWATFLIGGLMSLATWGLTNK